VRDRTHFLERHSGRTADKQGFCSMDTNADNNLSSRLPSLMVRLARPWRWMVAGLSLTSFKLHW
jgi:hypothetical protein